MLNESDTDTNVEVLFETIDQVLEGATEATFVMRVDISNGHGRRVYTKVNVISLVLIGAAKTGQYFASITGFALLFEELSPEKKMARKIKYEHHHLCELLKRIIPEQYVDRFRLGDTNI